MKMKNFACINWSANKHFLVVLFIHTELISLQSLPQRLVASSKQEELVTKNWYTALTTTPTNNNKLHIIRVIKENRPLNCMAVLCVCIENVDVAAKDAHNNMRTKPFLAKRTSKKKKQNENYNIGKFPSGIPSWFASIITIIIIFAKTASKYSTKRFCLCSSRPSISLALTTLLIKF